jgi:F0F1-type ATP synthase membrane subunit b/b'
MSSSYFDKIKAKAAEELEELRADGRPIDDKISEIFRLGAVHSRLNAIEDRFRSEVERLKVEAETTLRANVTRLRNELNAEAAKIRDELKAVK